MSVRSQLFRRGYDFDDTRGPIRGQPYSATGSEASLVSRACYAGYRCYFSNSPLIRHIVTREQLSYSYVMRRAFRYGRSKQLGEKGEGSHIRVESIATTHRLKLEVRSLMGRILTPLKGYPRDDVKRDWKINVERGRWYQSRFGRRDLTVTAARH